MQKWITVDGNEAAARVAYHLSEIIAIYPITPFGEYAYGETRYGVLRSLDPETAGRLAHEAQHDIDARWALYESLAKR
jgi:hypothetical protein